MLIDAMPNRENNLYRLKMLDKDGTGDYHCPGHEPDFKRASALLKSENGWRCWQIKKETLLKLAASKASFAWPQSSSTFNYLST